MLDLWRTSSRLLCTSQTPDPRPQNQPQCCHTSLSCRHTRVILDLCPSSVMRSQRVNKVPQCAALAPGTTAHPPTDQQAGSTHTRTDTYVRPCFPGVFPRPPLIPTPSLVILLKVYCPLFVPPPD